MRLPAQLNLNFVTSRQPLTLRLQRLTQGMHLSPRTLPRLPVAVFSSQSASSPFPPNLKMPSQRIRLMSWNIDMDTPPLGARTRSLLHQIRLHNPDVVLLQEVTSESFVIINNALCKSTISISSSENTASVDPSPQATPHLQEAQPQTERPPNPVYCIHLGDQWAEKLPYFPVMLIRVGLFTDPTVICERFPTSRMFRGFISAQGKLSKSGLSACFVTSHLESLKEGATERKDQLQQLFAFMRDCVSEGQVAVFAGDTNLREAEVSAKDVYKTMAAERGRKEKGNGEREKKRRRVQNAGQKFVDAWLAGGGVETEKFTWDMQKNDNLKFEGEFKPKARYDRIFMLWPKETNVETENFKLLGKERLAFGKFVSDHWGLTVDLNFTG